jgi:small subunit ribosomal protein S18
VCPFCVNKVHTIDYKEISQLRRFISDRGRMEPRRKTGVCAKHQRALSVALKRARHIALLPYTPEHIRVTGAFTPREAPVREHAVREHSHRELAPKEAPTREGPPQDESVADEVSDREEGPAEPPAEQPLEEKPAEEQPK